MGEEGGSESVSLSLAQLPEHDHSLPPAIGGFTSKTGNGAPYNNMQPFLGMTYRIATQGIFPSRNGIGAAGEAGDPFLAEVVLSANPTIPNGWLSTDGQILPLSQNTALFALLGTDYGGNGATTFALPDTRGRSVIHTGNGPGPGLSDQSLGQVQGNESLILLPSNLPPHLHTLPPSPDLTGITGLGIPQTNMQPTLAMNYIIALSGVYPLREEGNISMDDPFIGEISLFAGNFAPQGWAFCDGQILPLAQNTALFSILGTYYGGDGRTTFALPDLRDRLAVGFGQGPGLSLWDLGQQDGTEINSLSISEMPAHTHDYIAVPEPSSLTLISAGALLLARRRKR
jgi:microcystin-dependent protein